MEQQVPLVATKSEVNVNVEVPENNNNIEVAAPDISQFGKDTSTVITKLESALTSVDTQNIANLMAQTSVGMYDSTDKTTNQLITNDGLKVSINQMSPEVSAYIAATVRSMVSSALTGGTVTSDEEGNTTSLMEILSNLLQNTTLGVQVTNDNFDNALNKITFTS